MTSLDIARQRLYSQLIAQRAFDKPAAVVQWMGAVQAQDFAAAKWAVGLEAADWYGTFLGLPVHTAFQME